MSGCWDSELPGQSNCQLWEEPTRCGREDPHAATPISHGHLAASSGLFPPMGTHSKLGLWHPEVFPRKDGWRPVASNMPAITCEPCRYKAWFGKCGIKWLWAKQMQQENWFHLLLLLDPTRGLTSAASCLVSNLPESLANTLQAQPCFRMCSSLWKALSCWIGMLPFFGTLQITFIFFFPMFTKTLARRQGICFLSNFTQRVSNKHVLHNWGFIDK